MGKGVPPGGSVLPVYTPSNTRPRSIHGMVCYTRFKLYSFVFGLCTYIEWLPGKVYYPACARNMLQPGWDYI